MAAMLGLATRIFFGVSMGFKVFGLALNVGSMVATEVMKKDVQDLIDELKAEQQKLKDLGIDIQQGVEFFQDLSKSNDTISWSSQYVDDYVNTIITTQFHDIKSNGDQIVNDILAFPTTTVSDATMERGPVFWVGVGLALAQTVVDIGTTYKAVIGFLRFRDYVQSSGLPATEMEQVKAVSSSLNERFSDVERTNPALEESFDRIKTEPLSIDLITRTQKIGLAFDVVFSLASLGMLIYSIVEVERTEDELKQKNSRC